MTKADHTLQISVSRTIVRPTAIPSYWLSMHVFWMGRGENVTARHLWQRVISPEKKVSGMMKSNCLTLLSPNVCHWWRVRRIPYTLDGWPVPPNLVGAATINTNMYGQPNTNMYSMKHQLKQYKVSSISCYRIKPTQDKPYIQLLTSFAKAWVRKTPRTVTI